jgi:hypothetical protein
MVGQEYLQDWHPRLIGLTGTPEQVLHRISFIELSLRPIFDHIFHLRVYFLKHSIPFVPPSCVDTGGASCAHLPRVFFEGQDR